MGIRIIKGGMFTTVQDSGRTGYQDLGFHVCGAADRRSFRIANLLLDNPENEAKSFVQNLEPTFCPSTVFIVEGALSYCIPFLRDRFPQAKLVTIRLFNEFKDYDKDWDKVFYFSSSQFFDEHLFSYFGEEELLKSAFFTWKPVELNFPQVVQEVFECIKKAVSKSRDVLYTRSYFARRWFTNSINNICMLKNSSIINKIEKDILICASGPSLKESIEYIKKYRESFFII